MRRFLTRSRLVILGAGALSISTIAGLVGTGNLLGPAPAPTELPDTTNLGGAPVAGEARITTTTTRYSGAIDRTSRRAVNRAYWARYADNYSVPTTWSGATAGCKAGTISDKSRAATKESINFVRAMAGLEPVGFKSTWSSSAQKAALLMAANKSLSHDPPSNWACWTKDGANAAGRSNLSLAYPNLTSGMIVDLYMDDDGDSNIYAGHRRWLLNPFTNAMGNGSTSNTNAVFVVGNYDYSNANPRWVSWPTPGFFPSKIEPNHRWSLSSGNTKTDFSAARITMRTASGRSIKVTKWPVGNGYAMPTLVFQVGEAKAGVRYRVTVRNIKRAGTTRTFSHSYRVRLFVPHRP